jgi:hypothetical protein
MTQAFFLPPPPAAHQARLFEVQLGSHFSMKTGNNGASSIVGDPTVKAMQFDGI